MPDIPIIHFVLSDSVDYRLVFEDLHRQHVDWLDQDTLRDLWQLREIGAQHTEFSNFGPGFALRFVADHMAMVRFDRQTGAHGRYFFRCQYYVVEKSLAQKMRYHFGFLRPLLRVESQTASGTGGLCDFHLGAEPAHEQGRLDELLQRNAQATSHGLVLWLIKNLLLEAEPIVVADSPMDGEKALDVTELVSLLLPISRRPYLGFATHVCNAAYSSARLKFAVLPYGLQDQTVVRWDACVPRLEQPDEDYARIVSDALAEGWIRDLYQALQKTDVSRFALNHSGTQFYKQFSHAMFSQIRNRYQSPVETIEQLVFAPDGAERLKEQIPLWTSSGTHWHVEDLVSQSLWREVQHRDRSPELFLRNMTTLRSLLASPETSRLDRALLDGACSLVNGINKTGGTAEAFRAAYEMARIYPWEVEDAARLLYEALRAPIAEVSIDSLKNSLKEACVARSDLLIRVLGQGEMDDRVASWIVLQLGDRLPNRITSYRGVYHHDQPVISSCRVGNSPGQTWLVKQYQASEDPIRQPPKSCSPHLLCYDAVEKRQGGQVHLARRYVEGDPLHKVLSGPPLTLETALRGVQEIAEAVEYLHRQKQVHGNLHSRNVIWTAQGAVVVDERVVIPSSRQEELRHQDLRDVLDIGAKLLAKARWDLRQEDRKRLEQDLRKMSAVKLAQRLDQLVRAGAQPEVSKPAFQDSSRQVIMPDRLRSYNPNAPEPSARYASSTSDTKRLWQRNAIGILVAVLLGLIGYAAVRGPLGKRNLPPATSMPTILPASTTKQGSLLTLLTPPNGARLDDEEVILTWEDPGGSASGHTYRVFIEFEIEGKRDRQDKETSATVLRLSLDEVPPADNGLYRWWVVVVRKPDSFGPQSEHRFFEWRRPATPAATGLPTARPRDGLKRRR